MSEIENIPQTLDTFASSLQREEKSAVTIEKYLRDARQFLLHLGGQEITKDRIIAYKTYLLEQGYQTTSVNSMLASLNSFLTFLGLPHYRVKSVRTQRRVFSPAERELTREEYLRLLDVSASNAVEVTAFIQSLEEGVYVMNIEAWIDSDVMGYQDLSEQVFATGNATWPGLL